MWAKKILKKKWAPSRMSEFYFKLSKFALKRCNPTNTGTENEKKIRGSFKVRLGGNAQGLALPLIRIKLVTYKTRNLFRKKSQAAKKSWKHSIKQNMVFVWFGRPESRLNHQQQHLQRARQLAPNRKCNYGKTERRDNIQFGNKRWHVLGPPSNMELFKDGVSSASACLGHEVTASRNNIIL